MSKLTLTKDPSHKGYYLDEKGNLYVFRFGGRPIKVDGYRDDKPRENIEAKSIEVDKKDVIAHRKSASIDENNKFIDELDRDIRNKEHQKENIGGRSYEEYLNAQFGGPVDRMDLSEEDDDSFYKNYQDELSSNREKTKSLQKDIDNLTEEKKNTIKRLEDTKKEFNEKWLYIIDKDRAQDDLSRIREYDSKYNDDNKKNTIKRLEDTKKEFNEKWLYVIDKDRAQDDLARIREYDSEYNDDNKMSAKEFIKKQTGQREMYQSIAKLMNDNEDKLSSEEWRALDNARMILKQNPELIADDSVLSDTSKPIHERLSKYMNDNEYKLDSGVWGPLYKANNILRQNDNKEKTKLLDRYKQSVGVSDDWFTEEARTLKMSDEEIANAIYEKKGAEAQGSTDDNIKRIIAGKEKDKWQKQLDKYEKIIADPNTGDWDKQFAKSELQGIKNKVEEYADWEAEFIKRANKDDKTFIIRYDDGKSTDNFRVVGLKEALNMKEELQKYGDDIHVYDINGKEWSYDKDRKFYTSPRYEENKRANMISDMRSRLSGADRSTLVSMINRLGLHLNIDNLTTAQLSRILEKELYKDKK